MHSVFAPAASLRPLVGESFRRFLDELSEGDGKQCVFSLSDFWMLLYKDVSMKPYNSLLLHMINTTLHFPCGLCSLLDSLHEEG